MNPYFDFTQYKLLIFFFFGIIAGGVAVFLLLQRLREDKGLKEQGKAPFDAARGKELLIEKQAREKKENKQRILELFEEAQDKRVANDDVEKLLGVSDATATRYLDDLEKEGHIRQVGKTGRHVYYEKT